MCEEKITAALLLAGFYKGLKELEKVFLNDGLVDADKAKVSIRDGGFLYGAGLFETMRSFGGKVFCLDDHLERLFSSAKALSINNPYEKDFIKDAIGQVLEANGLQEARLRLTLTSGPMSLDEEPHATLLITATKLVEYPEEFYKQGALVVLCPYRQNVADPTCGHKVTSYFVRMLGLDFARGKRAAEALWFTTDNRLAEGCVSNVFLVKDSVLYTPKSDTPVLPGIARKTVIKIAKKNSIEVVEKDLFIDDVLGADEIFLTNVIMKALPVTRMEKHIVGDGKAGPIYRDISVSFDEMIKESCGR